MKKFSIPSFYKSSLIAQIKQKRADTDRLKKDLSPFCFDFQRVRFYLPRNFGFCYGVENAIDIIYQAVDNYPRTAIYVLSELIHNDHVNRDLKRRGVRFLMDTSGNTLIPWNVLKKGDIVVIPAFGATVETQQRLENLGVHIERYDTTCPFVRKVWNKSEELAKKGYTLLIHGKYYHEETKATFSHASRDATPCLIIKDRTEAELVAQYIQKKRPFAQFYIDFKGKHTPGFDPSKDLQRIGLVNQTTMLAEETNAIGLFLRAVIKKTYSLEESTITRHFADTRNTLCYATNDNQNALAYTLQHQPLDMAFVLGGYKSSNTTNLYRFCTQQSLPAYFIESDEKIISPSEMYHFDYLSGKEIKTPLPALWTSPEPKNILIVLGASCPDILAERLMQKLLAPYINDTKFQKTFAALCEQLSRSYARSVTLHS